MTTISIHQPNYIPWLGYFYKIAESDIFVFLDDAQYSNKGMHNYHYIKTPQGPFRLKIPVKESFGDKINTVCSRDEMGWKEKHLKILSANYKKAKFFHEIYNDFENLLNKSYLNIAVQNATIIKFFCRKLGIKTNFIEASSLNISTTRQERIIDICKALKGNIYCSGSGAKEYQKEEDFVQDGLILKYSEFKPFVYPQLWGAFQSNVTIIDYLMNCSYDWSRVLIAQSNEREK
jgi:hypothetical protein